MTTSPDSVEAVMKEFLPLTEKILEQAQTIAALRSALDETTSALRWLRAWWVPGSDHDTDEVKCGLAAADAALSQENV